MLCWPTKNKKKEVFPIAHRLDRTTVYLHNWIMHFKELYAEAPEKSDKAGPRTTIENDEDDRSDERTAHPEGVEAAIDRANREKARRLRDQGIEPAFEEEDDATNRARSQREMVEDLLAILDAKENELAKAKGEIDSLNQTIVDVVRDPSRCSATPGSTSVTSARGKSSKISDPPVFYADKFKDTVTFEVWYRSVANKLKVNADHFADDEARQAYIENRLAGYAAKDLQPYLRDTHPNQITASKALMAHLKRQYDNPNTACQAMEDFEKLRMYQGDFHIFKTNSCV